MRFSGHERDCVWRFSGIWREFLMFHASKHLISNNILATLCQTSALLHCHFQSVVLPQRLLQVQPCTCTHLMAAIGSDAETLDLELQQHLERLAPSINSKCAELRSSVNPADVQIKSVVDGMIAQLMECGLAYEEWVQSCDAFGPHNDNRWGAGLDALDVHTLLQKILRTGWSQPQTSGALAFEIAKGKRFDKQWEFQEKVFRRSGGMIARVLKQNLRFLTLACSHTIAGVRAVKHECKTPLSDYADSEGRLSKAKVLAMCKSYEAPLTHGMK